jgi:hypothetical protein
MKETPRRRITVTSSLSEISTDPLGKVGGGEMGGGGGGVLLRLPPPLPLQHASGQMFKDDVNGFSSTSDICIMVGTMD